MVKLLIHDKYLLYCYRISSKRRGLILDAIIQELYYGDYFSLLSSKQFATLYWAMEVHNGYVSKESIKLFFSKNLERAIDGYLNNKALDAQMLIKFSTMTAKQLCKKVKSKQSLNFFEKRKFCKKLRKMQRN